MFSLHQLLRLHNSFCEKKFLPPTKLTKKRHLWTELSKKRKSCFTSLVLPNKTIKERKCKTTLIMDNENDR